MTSVKGQLATVVRYAPLHRGLARAAAELLGGEGGEQVGGGRHAHGSADGRLSQISQHRASRHETCCQTTTSRIEAGRGVPLATVGAGLGRVPPPSLITRIEKCS
eukprot:1179150-Prorocentrum_minimum.AAC.2